MVLWLLALGLIVRWPDRRVLRVVAALSALLAVVVAGRFDSHSTQLFVPAWLAAGGCGRVGAMLAITFPYDVRR